MKKLFQRPALVGIASVMLFIVLSAFVVKRGGDSYTISINGKQVIQYYVLSKEALPSLAISPNSEDKLSVYFNECGKIGKSRSLSVRDDHGNVLKEWKYANALDEHTPMTISSGEIIVKGNVGLYYTSATVVNPRKLVTLVTGNTTSASLK